MSFALLFSVAIIATCGLIYELIAGALASYLLGDSITQFSLIIGVYLFSMGVGSYLSKYIEKKVLSTFINIEFLVGIVGGFSAMILFLAFEYVQSFRILLFFIVFLIGTFVGLEIPLLMRILKDRYEFKDLVSKVFTVDYIGALFASILFPLVLAPKLGLMRTGLLFGILNVTVGFWTLYLFRDEVENQWGKRAIGAVSMVCLIAGFIVSDNLMRYIESALYEDPIIYSKKSPYQQLVLTKGHDLKLFINGNLQFSSFDEYRYHEALIHPVMAGNDKIKSVLVLGGGDGLAVREILKYKNVETITLVDLDPMMTELFTKSSVLVRLNEDSLSHEKVKVVNTDAFVWLKQVNQKNFDLIVIDFPDPSNFSLGKLYSRSFFHLVRNSLTDEGRMVIQSTSPYFARRSFWCVGQTLEDVGLNIYPYHAYVPSFGEWGYFIATKSTFEIPTEFISGLKFVDAASVRNMFNFPPDMKRVDSVGNRLNNQILVRIFEEEWSHYN